MIVHSSTVQVLGPLTHCTCGNTPLLSQDYRSCHLYSGSTLGIEKMWCHSSAPGGSRNRRSERNSRGYLTAPGFLARSWAPRLTPCTARVTSLIGRSFLMALLGVRIWMGINISPGLQVGFSLWQLEHRIAYITMVGSNLGIFEISTRGTRTLDNCTYNIELKHWNIEN